MRRRALFMLVAVAATSALANPVLAKAALYTTPAAPVMAMYNPAVKEADRPYSANLRKLFNAARKKSRQSGEVVSGLDFDPTISAQDHDENFRSSLKFSVEPGPNRIALVFVHLKVFKDSPTLRLIYEVIRDGEGYVIDDIVNPDPKEGWRWSKLLAAGAKGE